MNIRDKNQFQSLQGLILTRQGSEMQGLTSQFQSLQGLILTARRVLREVLLYFISIPPRSDFNGAARFELLLLKDISIPPRSDFNSGYAMRCTNRTIISIPPRSDFNNPQAFEINHF